MGPGCLFVFLFENPVYITYWLFCTLQVNQLSVTFNQRVLRRKWTKTRIRLHKFSLILTRFCHSWQMFTDGPEYECWEWWTGLVVWHNQRTVIWCLRRPRKVYHVRIFCIFFLLVWQLLWCALDVPSVVKIDYFFTIVCKDMKDDWSRSNVYCSQSIFVVRIYGAMIDLFDMVSFMKNNRKILCKL